MNVEVQGRPLVDHRAAGVHSAEKLQLPGDPLCGLHVHRPHHCHGVRGPPSLPQRLQQNVRYRQHPLCALGFQAVRELQPGPVEYRLSPDGDGPAGEVHTVPAQPQRLTPAQTGEETQAYKDVQVIALGLCRRQQGADLALGEGHPLGWRCPARLKLRGHRAHRNDTVVNGELEHLPHPGEQGGLGPLGQLSGLGHDAGNVDGPDIPDPEMPDVGQYMVVQGDVDEADGVFVHLGPLAEVQPGPGELPECRVVPDIDAHAQLQLRPLHLLVQLLLRLGPDIFPLPIRAAECFGQIFCACHEIFPLVIRRPD